MGSGIIAVIKPDNLPQALQVCRAAGIQRPLYREVEIKGQVYIVFSELPAAVLLKIQVEMGVKLI